MSVRSVNRIVVAELSVALAASVGAVALPVVAPTLQAVGVVGIADAQEARPGDPAVPLELKRGPKPDRPIVRPDGDGSQVTREAAKAAAEYEQRQRDEAIVREPAQQVPRRPDLGYDVTSGIQQRNIQRR
jgi:hypothetical protein